MFSAIQDTHTIWIHAFEYVSILIFSCSLVPLSTLSQWLLSPSFSRNKTGFPALLPDSSNKPVLSLSLYMEHPQSTYTQPSHAYTHTYHLALLPKQLAALQVETDLWGDCCWYAKPGSSCPGSQWTVCHCIKAICQLTWNAPEFPISTKQHWWFFHILSHNDAAFLSLGHWGCIHRWHRRPASTYSKGLLWALTQVKRRQVFTKHGWKHL